MIDQFVRTHLAFIIRQPTGHAHTINSDKTSIIIDFDHGFHSINLYQNGWLRSYRYTAESDEPKPTAPLAKALNASRRFAPA